MSIFKPIGKAAKFTFVTAPLSVFGWQLNKRLFIWIRTFWTRAINPACPQCDSGVLLSQRGAEPVLEPSENGDRPRRLYPWVCHHCDFGLLASLDPRAVREVVGRHRLARARSTFTALQLAEREEFARKHRLASRMFFGMAAFNFTYFVYMLGSGASLLLALNGAAFALMFWVFGMKRSYRAWQVLSGHIFEQGAARYWFKHEKWLI